MTSRYKYVKRKYHPLSPPSGRIPEHRLVLWEKIGPGTHPCFRCGDPVTWSDQGTAPGVLTVNHMDNNSRNNDPSNLEPSCHSCNLAYEIDSRLAGKPVILAHGKRYEAVERVCEHCGTDFLIRLSEVTTALKHGKTVGRFCSRRCHYDSR